MQPAIVHSWFRPNRRFTVGDVEWSTDGHAAIIMTPPDDTPPLRPGADPLALIDAPAVPASVTERRNGCAMLGGLTFSAYTIGLAEAAYPALAWHVHTGADRDVGHAIGRVDGAPVALVMSRRGPMPANPIAAPRCPACRCDECGCSGKTTCQSCDQDRDCPDCDGRGFLGGCEECGGDGQWKEPVKP